MVVAPMVVLVPRRHGNQDIARYYRVYYPTSSILCHTLDKWARLATSSCDYAPFLAKYSPMITRAVSGMEPSIRFLRSFSKARSISSVMLSMNRFIKSLCTY